MKKVCLLVLFINGACIQGEASVSQAAVGAFMFGAVSTVAAVAIAEGVPYVVRKIKSGGLVKRDISLPDEWAGPLPEDIERLCEFHARHRYYLSFNLTPPRGYLLYGPPGTGKTLLAESLSKKLGIPLLKETSGRFLDKLQGSGISRLSALLDRARRCKKKKGYFRCIVFIDEIDGICCREEQYNREELRLAEELLTVITAYENREILFVGATNLIETVDQAFTRPGRLIPVYMDYPQNSSREVIFKTYLKKHSITLDQLTLSSFISMTEGFSPAAIRYSIEQALYLHLRNTNVSFGIYLEQAIKNCARLL